MKHREFDQTLTEIRRKMTKAQLIKFAVALASDETVPYEALMHALDEAQKQR